MGSAGWTETVLHSFAGGADGLYPQAGLLPGPNGVLYGTTRAGGSSEAGFTGDGTVFKTASDGGGNLDGGHHLQVSARFSDSWILSHSAGDNGR